MYSRLINFFQNKFKLRSGSNKARDRLLRLEPLEDRKLLTATSVAPTVETGFVYGPPDYQTWLQQQSLSAQALESPPIEINLTATPEIFTNSLLYAASVSNDSERLVPQEDLYEKFLYEDPSIADEGFGDSIEIIGETIIEAESSQLDSVTYLPQQGGASILEVDNFDSLHPLATTSGSGGSGGGSGGVDWELNVVTSVNSASGMSIPYGNVLFEGAGVGSGGASFDPDAIWIDYMTITVPALPDGYNAPIFITRSTSSTPSMDFCIYNSSYQMVDISSDYFEYSVSGGTTQFYLVPINDNICSADLVVQLTLGLPYFPGVSGGGDYNFILPNSSVIAGIVDDDLEFLSDVDLSNSGAPITSVPLGNTITKNADVYDLDFIYGKPTVGTVIRDAFEATQRTREVKYSIVSGNESNYFTIDEATGQLSWNSLPSFQQYNFDLVIKVADSMYPQVHDMANVSFTVGWGSFVLLVETPCLSSPTGHGSWRIEATSSLLNYCCTEFSSSIEIGGVSDSSSCFSETTTTPPEKNLLPFVLHNWGFYPASNLNATPTNPDPHTQGEVRNDDNRNAHVDVYLCKTIGSMDAFLTVVRATRNRYYNPGYYYLLSENCTTVAVNKANYSAGLSIGTSQGFITPVSLSQDLMDVSLNQGGVQGTYTFDSANDY
ncbi:MAG: cadherin repeat domain-containing protein [Thermoguttaceae bacterium]|nr:cadherin repeat domain-containing protein [Thermoguttaceae bacterium]